MDSRKKSQNLKISNLKTKIHFEFKISSKWINIIIYYYIKIFITIFETFGKSILRFEILRFFLVRHCRLLTAGNMQKPWCQSERLSEWYHQPDALSTIAATVECDCSCYCYGIEVLKPVVMNTTIYILQLFHWQSACAHFILLFHNLIILNC